MNDKTNANFTLLSEEYVRMYYTHQFERMGRLEDQRLLISNLVITITILAFSFGFGELSNIGVIHGLGLPILIILANLFAIAYVTRASRSIAVLRQRADHILQEHVTRLKEIDNALPWEKSGFLGSRTEIQRRLHYLLMITALVPVLAYFKVIP